MAALHISEAELTRDVHAILEQVRQGGDVGIERDHQPVAIIQHIVGLSGASLFLLPIC